MNDFGTDPELLYRKADPDTSKDAAYTVDSADIEMQVFNTILEFGKTGCIHDEVADILVREGVHYDSISPRYSALLNKGFIRDSGIRRIGHSGCMQRVMVAHYYVKPRKNEGRKIMGIQLSTKRINKMRGVALDVFHSEIKTPKEIELAEMVLDLTREILDQKLMEEKNAKTKA